MDENFLANEEEFEFSLLNNMDGMPDWHTGLEIVFLLRGKAWLQLEGGDSHYIVREGDLFVVNAFQIRTLMAEEGTVALSLRISSGFLAFFCPEEENLWFECKSFLFQDSEQQPFDVLRSLLARSFRIRYKGQEHYHAHLRSHMAMLVDELLRNFLVRGKQSALQDAGRAHLRKAADYIHRHYKENISLTALAEHTFLSPSYFSRSFKKYLGITFTEYLTQVRLLHASSLLGHDLTITEIAYETGFPNAGAMIEAFKHYRGVTPGQYRSRERENRSVEQRGAYQEAGGLSMVFDALMKYADQPAETEPVQTGARVCELEVDTAQEGKKLSHNWKRMINAGYAKDLLNDGLQKQIRHIQKEVGFRYIRCKGVLDDDMVLYTRDMWGNNILNYVCLDEVVDFILSAGAKPFLEFGHMPSMLAKDDGRFMSRAACISAPKDLTEWEELIGSVIRHLLERYGKAELEQWLFVPWMTQDFKDMGFFTAEEYRAAYCSSYRAIRACDPALRICGAAGSVNQQDSLAWFLEMCLEENCLPDILCLRSFATINPGDEPDALKLVETNTAFSMAVSKDEDYLAHSIQKVYRFLEKKGLSDLPVMLDEWSNNIWQRDLCNDTSYKSAYIFKSILENYDTSYGMGYFSIGDALGEVVPAAELFHGGFGLFTKNGIPKSACRAMELLGQVGDRLLARGSGWFVTEKEGEIQIFLYHYCHYDLLYRYRHTTNLTPTERYQVFSEKPPVAFHISLTGLESGGYEIRRYGIGPKGGSTYDAWIAMGAPEPMSEEEQKRLICQSVPCYHTEKIESDGTISVKASLIPHEVQLIRIRKK